MPDNPLTKEQEDFLTLVKGSINGMNTEDMELLKMYLKIVNKDPSLQGGVFHKEIAMYYERLHKASTQFLRYTNERGFPALDPTLLTQHIIPLHKFLTHQLNEMILASQNELKKRTGK